MGREAIEGLGQNVEWRVEETGSFGDRGVEEEWGEYCIDKEEDGCERAEWRRGERERRGGVGI